ncbi:MULTISPECIES: flagellar hook-length control protein FliK [Polaromonas]|uniref:Flagellar hook-length control protein FliK n=1 Tax=Polaromonas aquatica TaxID=332657 RepID=A0ABW1TYA9_9BURK
MSISLPSTTAPSLSGSPNTGATTRQDEQGQNKPGSFGEALSRSMAPARETPEKTDTKVVKPSNTRRLSEEKKTGADDLVNAMTLALPPLDARTAKLATPAGGTSTLADNTKPGSAALPLADLPANTATPADTPAQAPEVDANAALELTPPPALALAGQKDMGQAALKTELPPVNDGPAIQLEPGKIGNQPSTGDKDTSDQSAGRNDTKDPSASVPTEAGTGLTPGTSRNAAKTPPASTTALTPEAMVNSPVASQAAPEAVASTNGTAPMSPMSPMITGMQGSGPVSAPIAATPVASAMLRPEVGSSEWGKALGQQVIQMGTSGHQVAELQLNPPGLGPLKITLSMNEHQVQAMFASAHASVRAAVEAALPQLRSTLADSGISLGNTSVSSGSQQQAAFAGKQDEQPGSRTYQDERAAAPTPASPIAGLPARSSRTGLDTYA